MTYEELTTDHQVNHHVRFHRPLRSALAIVTASVVICGAVAAVTLAHSVAAPPITVADAFATTSPTPISTPSGEPSPRHVAKSSPALATPSTPHAPMAEPANRPTDANTPTPVSGYGCSAALAYLRTHAAPGFRFECPGYALGHQAMTCANHPPQCPGARIIVIAVPCRAAYMNEASNSWVLLGLRHHAIDPYGYCH
jgi:hypothetical protein